jgi:acyl carrier protein
MKKNLSIDISDHVREKLGIADLDLDDLLCDRGVDSVTRVELILMLEELLDHTFDEADLNPESFETLRSMQTLADRVRSAKD